MKTLKYLLIDFNSIAHQFQFQTEEQYQKFYLLINELISENNIPIYLIISTNCHIHRYKQYSDLGIHYSIQNLNIEHHIIEKIINELSNSYTIKLAQFSDYEIKDIIFSTINAMYSYISSKNIELEIKLLTSNRLLALSSLFYLKKPNLKFQYYRYIKSKSFTGLETVNNMAIFLKNTYGLNLKPQSQDIDFCHNNDTEFNLLFFNYIEDVLNQFMILCGLDYTNEEIKLFNGFGEKRAVQFLNKYYDIRNFISCYDEIDDTIKKYLPLDKLQLASKLAEINKIKMNISPDIIFKTLRK